MESQHRNTKGGKGWKKRKTGRERAFPKKDEVVINVENGEGHYAVVKRILIGNQVEVMTNAGTTVTAIMPGRMRKGRRGNWIKKDMLLLIDNYNEIIKIMKASDKNTKKATDMMKKVMGSSTFFFDEESGSESGSDDDIICPEQSSQHKTNAELGLGSGSESCSDLVNPNMQDKNKKNTMMKKIKNSDKSEMASETESETELNIDGI